MSEEGGAVADGDQEPDDWAAQLAQAAGEGAEVGDAFGVPVFDVPSGHWLDTLRAAQQAGLAFFDWLSAVDDRDEGFTVVAHVADMSSWPLLHLLIRTRISQDEPTLPSATSVYRGAAWHERETHEMFGITFDGHPNLTKLLLPDEFEGHPLRKDFVLAARAAKPWPGAKEPGEGGAASPSRRRMQPPGVPDPSWGPRPPGKSAEEDEAGAVTEEVPEQATEEPATAEKSAAKKTTAKKSAAKKTTAKKAPTKKTGEKASAKKTAAKKTTTKKASAKKAAPKKATPAKKSPGKKASGTTTDSDAKSPRDDGDNDVEPGGDAT